MIQEKKQSYVKQYDKNGKVINLITKDTAYLHISNETRRMRRGKERINFIKIGEQLMAIKQKKTTNGKWVNI